MFPEPKMASQVTAHTKAEELNIIAAAEDEELKPNIIAEADNIHALPKPKTTCLMELNSLAPKPTASPLLKIPT